MNTLKSLLFFIIFTNFAFSQSLDNNKIEKYFIIADKIIKYALENEEGYKLLEGFCQFGPRLSGSENSLKSIFWAEKKMKELGFENVTLQPVMVPHWVRGNIEKCIITKSKFFKNRKLNVGALGGSVSTIGKNIEAEIIEVKSFDELNKLGEKVKGKIVLYNRPMEKGLVNTMDAYGRAVDQRSMGAINAAKYGAIAVIVRSVTTKEDNSPHLGSVNYSDEIPKIPAIVIGIKDANLLSEAIKKEPDLKVKIELNCKTLPDILSYNLFCDIVGTEYPDEVILLVGHSDSWDAGVGAHDDAAGCIHALEVLNIIKSLNLKPKRTIRCAFIINEENGIRGALAYGKYSDTCKYKHICALESDRGGGSPLGFYATADSLKFLKISSWLPILQKANIEWIRHGGGGVDISKVKTDVTMGFAPDILKYFDFHHSANDVLSEVHPREFELGAAAIAILSYLISEEGL